MADDLLDTRWGRLLVSGAAGIAGVAGSYALTGASPAFLASPVERTLTRTMPGAIVSFAITTLGSLGQQLNFVTAIGLTALFVALAARAALIFGEAANNRIVPAVGTALIVWVGAVVLTDEVVLSAGGALSAAGVVVVAQVLDAASDGSDPISAKRRRALGTVGLALGASALGFSVGRGRTPAATGDEAPLQAPGADLEDAQAKLDTAEANGLAVDGIEPLVSEQFFEVDINSIDPSVDAADWSLTITGAVEEEITLDYDDLQAMAARNQFSTLRCVGETLNGKKMDNALWTGVPVDQFLDEAGVQSGCECVMLRADDDYFEEFPIDALRDGLLVYGMNGKLLPGVTAIPSGRWCPATGEINVKWLTEIEVLEQEAQGYWEKRGWHGTGPVKAVAKLHHAELLDDGRRELGGHAYAGTRGVSAVEVSTDGGETWSAATLSEPLPDDDVWRQWTYTYDPPADAHTVVVRMVDEDGTVQPSEETGRFPSGPSGWVTREFA
ncbi:molybdopterin-dependent oxidoreductase [Halomicroarcula sp. GCM10025709]|uniref:molybdopterin-dependent oxidoreductase n=1 Tax=Halomicroarcula sp. GCM10025709 TaxID=3252669 RepID=UPI003622920E